MGVEIVKAAMVYGKSLSGNGYKVLITMAMSALDKPSNGRPPGLYWGGWDALAVCLGHEDARRDGQGHKAVKRAVKELRDKDHITPMVNAARGTRQSYLVHPGGLNKGAQDGPVKGAQSDPVKGAQNGPQRGVEMGPPRKEQGSTSDLSQDTTPHEAASTTGSDVASKDGAEKSGVGSHQHVGGVDDDCAECGMSYQNRAHFRRGLRAV